MVVKLAIQELLKGTQTSLRSLDEDLVAPWYIWLNRREKGTQYEKLDPLEFNVAGMRILRWYGIDFKRNEACPTCGNFEQQLTMEEEVASIKLMLEKIHYGLGYAQINAIQDLEDKLGTALKMGSVDQDGNLTI